MIGDGISEGLYKETKGQELHQRKRNWAFNEAEELERQKKLSIRTPESVLGAKLAVGTPLSEIQIPHQLEIQSTPSASSKGSHTSNHSLRSELHWSKFDFESPSFQSPATSGRGINVLNEPPPAPKPCRVASAFPLGRTNSLDETKVLLTTTLSRSDSIMMPELFKFTQHFEFQKVIGRSDFSEVWLVRHRTKQTLYAIKQRSFVSRSERERYLREMLAVVELAAHANIIMYYRAWQEDAILCIQMEYCEGGSLKEQLEKQDCNSLNFTQLLSLTIQLASALEFLQSHNILHLDIKPENIFLDTQGRYKIGDFGLAVYKNQWIWEEGDGRYVAPELLRDNAVATAAADIYSFGSLLYESATGTCWPRSGQAINDDTFVRLSELPQEFVEMLRAMLSPLPLERPNASQIRIKCQMLQSASLQTIESSFQKQTTLNN